MAISAEVRKRIEQVREAIHDAGRNLLPADWKLLLEEISTDIEGHLDALSEEGHVPNRR